MDTQAIAGARLVDPHVLARIQDLELLARTVVDGFINGLHRAPYFGASVDFAEHRGYVAGDDIRRVLDEELPPEHVEALVAQAAQVLLPSRDA